MIFRRIKSREKELINKYLCIDNLFFNILLLIGPTDENINFTNFLNEVKERKTYIISEEKL